MQSERSNQYRILSLKLTREYGMKQQQFFELNPGTVVPEVYSPEEFAKLVGKIDIGEHPIHELGDPFAPFFTGCQYSSRSEYIRRLQMARSLLGPISSSRNGGTHYEYRKNADIVGGWMADRYSFIMEVEHSNPFFTRLIRYVGFTSPVPIDHEPSPEMKLFVSHYYVYRDAPYKADDVQEMVTRVCESSTVLKHPNTYISDDKINLNLTAIPKVASPIGLISHRQSSMLNMGDDVIDLRAGLTERPTVVKSVCLIPSIYAVDMLNAADFVGQKDAMVDTPLNHAYADMAGYLSSGGGSSRDPFRILTAIRDDGYDAMGALTYAHLVNARKKEPFDISIGSNPRPFQDLDVTTPALMAMLQQLDVAMSSLGFTSWGFNLSRKAIQHRMNFEFNAEGIRQTLVGTTQGSIGRDVYEEAVMMVQTIVRDFREDLRDWAEVYKFETFSFSGAIGGMAYMNGVQLDGAVTVSASYPTWCQSMLTPWMVDTSTMNALAESVFSVIDKIISPPEDTEEVSEGIVGTFMCTNDSQGNL